MTKTVFTPEYRDLIYWLVDARKRQRLNQRVLAKRLGVVRSYIGRIETFERRLDVYEFVLYCQALNLDPHDGISLLLSAQHDG